MTKSGLGTSSQKVGDITIGAIVAVNALGDVTDPKTGEIIAGPRDTETGGFINTIDIMKNNRGTASPALTNTTIAVVATDASLDNDQANKVSQLAHDGMARAIRPAHTMVDGDVIFTVATGKVGPADVTLVGAVAAELVAQTIVKAIRQADSLAGVPAARDFN
jgi:L-aminopeptidase/D-esterase-like protein